MSLASFCSPSKAVVSSTFVLLAQWYYGSLLRMPTMRVSRTYPFPRVLRFLSGESRDRKHRTGATLLSHIVAKRTAVLAREGPPRSLPAGLGFRRPPSSPAGTSWTTLSWTTLLRLAVAFEQISRTTCTVSLAVVGFPFLVVFAGSLLRLSLQIHWSGPLLPNDTKFPGRRIDELFFGCFECVSPSRRSSTLCLHQMS